MLALVGTCCVQFETSQTFGPTSPNISIVLWPAKRSLLGTPTILASWKRLRTRLVIFFFKKQTIVARFLLSGLLQTWRIKLSWANNWRKHETPFRQKNRKTRVNAPKYGQTTRWNSWLTFSRKTLASGTCQIKTIIWGKNVRGPPINRLRKGLGQKGLLLRPK